MTGPELKAARESMMWSQRDLARRLGMSRGRLEALERQSWPVREDLAAYMERAIAATWEAPVWFAA